MNKQLHIVRKAKQSEFQEIGKLMVDVYSQLDGFPKEAEMPNYYRMLTNVGELTANPHTNFL